MPIDLAAAIPADLVPPDAPWPVVLGIDPGTRVVGYGAVVAARGGPRLLVCGAIDAGPHAVPERLARIARDVRFLLGRLRPAAVVVEKAFHAQNAQSALRLGEGRGVILAAAAEHGCRIVEYPPAVAKKALCHGGATKAQIRAMVMTILGLAVRPEPDDASDALALALTHVHRVRLGDLLGR